MSFSSEIKKELAERLPESAGSQIPHCQIAELAAILALAGHFRQEKDGSYSLLIRTENAFVARKFFTLSKNVYNIKNEVRILKKKSGLVYLVSVEQGEVTDRMLTDTGILQGEEGEKRIGTSLAEVPVEVIRRKCCKRAYLRGAFLAAGSMTNPEHSYHFEIAVRDEAEARRLREIIRTFGIDARMTNRKNHTIVYVKEGDQIADFLRVMEAPGALMAFMNIRIVKEVRNSVNRQVNFEMANINKTADAASRQLAAIRLLQEEGRFKTLPPALKVIAELRMEYPEATLAELGRMLDPPIGKSGVNHRLNKLTAMVDMEE